MVRRPRSFRFKPGGWRSGFVVILCLLIAALALSGMMLTRKSVRRALPRIMDLSMKGRVPGDPYIGSRVCRECHSNEYALFLHTGHARTLRLAADHPVARIIDGQTVTDPEIPGLTWTYALADDQLRAERRFGGQIEKSILDYAFGSSRHATTFLTLTDANKPTGTEHRLSYFGQPGRLDVTPGQEKQKAPGTSSRGRYLTPKITLQCFSCHATQTSAVSGRPFDADTLIPNVTCERCHGPSRKHVDAARRGETDLTMPFGFDQWTAETQMKLCGECHRHPSLYAPGAIDPNEPGLVRFQPVGLMQSRCYERSGGSLSCITCHDPHAHASSDTASYEAACLGCHSSSTQAVCPKSPGNRCLECHMPRLNLGTDTFFTDHWIRRR
jgi:hypothetical protein